MRRIAVMSMMLVAVALAGCARDEGTALDRDAFYRPPPGTDVRRHELRDEPEPPTYNQVGVNLLNPKENTLEALRRDDSRPQAGQSVTGLSPVVRDVVRVPNTAGDGTSAAANSVAPGMIDPEPRPRPGTSSGVALTIGTVVCEVNGEPIYADKVLKSLTRVLSAEARQRDERSFRAFATQVISDEVRAFITTELAYAAATKHLDFRERELARNLTMQWRMRQITEAGGSLELARARAAAEGYDFEERVEEEFRTLMVQIYYQKRLLPRTQVRAEDIRNYYARNIKRFTEPDQARFRLIRIDASKTGGVEKAREKIENLRQRAARGEDFAELASGANDDPALMRSGGDVDWIQRGAFRIEPVEQAVWAIQPGEVTDLIPVGDSFYIAKLEERKLGRVRPFEEAAVQKEIIGTLEREQLEVLKKRQEEALMKEMIVHPMPPNIEPVVEMAMQRYDQWASTGK